MKVGFEYHHCVKCKRRTRWLRMMSADVVEDHKVSVLILVCKKCLDRSHAELGHTLVTEE